MGPRSDCVRRFIRQDAGVVSSSSTIADESPLPAFGMAGGDTRLIGAILLISEKLAKLEFEPEPKQVALELEQLLVFGQELPFVRASRNDVVGLV